MRLIVVFITADKTVLEAVAQRRASLVPREIRADSFNGIGKYQIVLSAFDATLQASSDDIVAHLQRSKFSDASGVILLIDDSIPNLIDNLGDQFCINRFAPPKCEKNVANILSSILAKCLRAFNYLQKRFNDLKYHQIFRLPLRNFNASEITEMRRACRYLINQDNYAREIDRILQKIRRRQRPKKASSYPGPYYVDDKGKHFQLGHELHAQADTKMPPHNCICIVANQFRFGCIFDGKKHYNVSRDGDSSMAGSYLNCHEENQATKATRHLNMFTNDFF